LTIKNDLSFNTSEMRARAEQRISEGAVKPVEFTDRQSSEDLYQVLHELHVHQIELEMQNEELRTTQDKLEASRARYFNFFDMAPVGYLTISQQGLILESNLTAASMLSLPRSELFNQPITQFILKEDQDIYYLHRKTLFETKEPQVCDLRLVHKNSQPLWIQFRATFAQDSETPVCRLILNDITERKQAENIRLDLEQRLQEKEKTESLGRMAAGIAHHYNNLLTIIMGNLEQAMEFPSIGNLPKQKLAAAMSAASRAAEIGGLMLAYIGKTMTRHVPLDLSEVCRRCLTDIGTSIPQNITIEPALPVSALSVNANAGQIKQILSNLVTNAREAIAEEQGTISMIIKDVAPKDIASVHCYPCDFQPGKHDYACLEIKDTGSGIPETDFKKLFEPFYSTRFTGRGLGLPVVFGAIKSHNGCITVESKLGQGSIFRVYLPISDEATEPQSLPVKKLTVIPKNGKILLIEDEPMIRRMTATSLTGMGVSIIEARDGVEAIELFQQHQDEIVCVLCDLTMPRMDGWKTLELLRKIAPEIPVILTSGYNESQAMEGSHSELPQVFLQKPYGLKNLKDAIQEAMLSANRK